MNERNVVSKVPVLVGRKRRPNRARACRMPELPLFDMQISESTGAITCYDMGSVVGEGCAACHPYSCACDMATDTDASEGLDSEDKDALPLRMGMGSGGQSEADRTTSTCHTTWGFPPSASPSRAVGRENLPHNPSQENRDGILDEGRTGLRVSDEGIRQTLEGERRQGDSLVKGISTRVYIAGGTASPQLRQAVALGNWIASGNFKCTNSAIKLSDCFKRKRKQRKK